MYFRIIKICVYIGTSKFKFEQIQIACPISENQVVYACYVATNYYYYNYRDALYNIRKKFLRLHLYSPMP